jgi:hypothetical protein
MNCLHIKMYGRFASAALLSIVGVICYRVVTSTFPCILSILGARFANSGASGVIRDDLVVNCRDKDGNGGEKHSALEKKSASCFL